MPVNDLPPPAIVRAIPPATPTLIWQQLPALPEGAGVAGAFIGVLGDALFIAGGASFPEGPASGVDGKQFTAQVQLLSPDAAGQLRWRKAAHLKLPRPAGYGAAVPDKHGLILIGGRDRTTCFADVTRIRLGPDGTLATEPLPPLPVPLANFSAARLDDLLLVAGGQETPDGAATRHCFTLDLTVAGARWQSLPAWPGAPRLMAMGMALGREFVLISGKNPQPGRPTETLTDAYALQPATRSWRRLTDVGRPVEPAVPVMAATGVALDGHRLLVLGGGAYQYLARTEELAAQLQAARAQGASTAEIAALAQGRATLVHPGFQREVRLYDARTDRWQCVGLLPMARPPVNTTAVHWRGAFVLPTGEILPATRTPAIWQATLAP